MVYGLRKYNKVLKMIKSYRVEVFFKDVDVHLFNLNCGIKKYLYNMFLSINKERYEKGESFLGYMEFDKWLNNEYFIKNPEMLWIKKGSQKNRKDALRLAELAIKRFFKKISKYPKYKKRRDKVSFYFVNDNHIRLERHKIKIPIFGWLRLKEFGYLDGIDVKKIKSGNLVKEANKFYVCLRVDVENEVEITNVEKSEGIGVDLGLLNYATVSNGDVYKKPDRRYLRILERRREHLQKELNRRLKKTKSKKERLEKDRKNLVYKKLYQEGKLDIDKNKNFNEKEVANKKVISKNTIKTINKLQVVEAKIRRIRKGFVVYVVNSLVKQNPQFITIEDLNIKGMIKNRYLSKAIWESNFGYFREFLSYRCKKLGIELRVVDRFYPSSKLCSNCNSKKDNLTLSDRVYVCNNCGLEIDRDLNAAINLSRVPLAKTGIYA